MSSRWSNLQALVDETFLVDVEAYDSVSSTNDLALGRAAQRPSAPLLFLADQQQAGRGRGGNVWWSGTGAILASLLLQPEQMGIPRSRWPSLSVAVGGAIAAAVTELICEHGPAAELGAQIKWPNDVYLQGRKICGVLVETPPQVSDYLVIGFGLNVNNRLVQAPPDLRGRLISLADVLGRELPRQTVLTRVLQQLETDLQSLAAQCPRLIERWRRQCLLRGTQITVRDGLRATSGTCLGLDDDGALRVLTEGGPVRLFGGTVETWG